MHVRYQSHQGEKRRASAARFLINAVQIALVGRFTLIFAPRIKLLMAALDRRGITQHTHSVSVQVKVFKVLRFEWKDDEKRDAVKKRNNSVSKSIPFTQQFIRKKE